MYVFSILLQNWPHGISGYNYNSELNKNHVLDTI